MTTVTTTICLAISFCLASVARGYLSSARAELLAPLAGSGGNYLWLGFETSSSDSLFDDAPYHSILVEEETGSTLQFGDCSSVVELAASWPGLVDCTGGLHQLDAPLRPSTWYQMVLLVAFVDPPLPGVGLRLRLRLGRQTSVPILPAALARATVTFFESSRDALEPAPVGEWHFHGPSFPNVSGTTTTTTTNNNTNNNNKKPDRQTQVSGASQLLQVTSPLTFVVPGVSFQLDFALRFPTASLAGPVAVLVMAKPFTIWGLQPEGASVTAPGGADAAASCMAQLSVTPAAAKPSECYWVSFGSAPDGSRPSANGMKFVFPGPALPLVSNLQVLVRAPSSGSFQAWLTVVLEGDGAGTAPGATPARRALVEASQGVAVRPVPITQIIAHSTSAVSAENVVQLQLRPGATLRGSSSGDLNAMGYIRVKLPEGTGQLTACGLQPSKVWATSYLTTFKRYIVRVVSSDRSCYVFASSAGRHFFGLSSYVLQISFYNSGYAVRGEDSAWQVEIRAPGALASPAGTTHSFSLVQPFDVVADFSLFKVRLSRLAVSEAFGYGPKALARVDFVMDGASSDYEGMNPVGCVRLVLPMDWSLGTQCDHFQPLQGLPAATACKAETSLILQLVLPGGISLPSSAHMAFSVQVWNPSARTALRGEDTAPWTLEARYGRSCTGPVRSIRSEHLSAAGNWRSALYPLVAELPFIGASNYLVASTATAIVRFVLPASLEAGAFLILCAPRGFSWTLDKLGFPPVDTTAATTGSDASWDLWGTKDPAPASLGDYSNELLLTVGGRGLQPLSIYGIAAGLIHPGSDGTDAMEEDPRWWSLEAFRTLDGARPAQYYRQDMASKVPFPQRVAAAASAGYSLRSLKNCEVRPWDNRVRQLTPVLLRFTPTVSMDAVLGGYKPLLRVEPPPYYIFRAPCSGLAPRPAAAADEVLARELLVVSKCRPGEQGANYVSLVIEGQIAAGVPYVVEVWSLEVPSQSMPLQNTWRLSLRRDASLKTVDTNQEVSICDGIQGFGVALPLPRASLLLGAASFRQLAASEVTFVFGTPQPTVGDYTLTIEGPVGALFPADCLSAVRNNVVVPLASAALPGHFIRCLGSGGGPDRARAELLSFGDGAGGMLPGEVYSITIELTNAPFVAGLSNHANSWRVSLSDPLWHMAEAVAPGHPSYDLTPPVSLDFRISDKLSTDPYSSLGPTLAFLTVRFTVPEPKPAGTTLMLLAPPDSFEFMSPCQLNHTDQLDWNLPPIETGGGRTDGRLSASVFTGSCQPGCVSLVTVGTCFTQSSLVLRTSISIELHGATPYCFAVLTKSPIFGGAGPWSLELRSPSGQLLQTAGPVAGPEAGALGVPGADHSAPFLVDPSARSKAARVVTLTLTFSLPTPLLGQAEVVIVSPAVGGALAFHADDVRSAGASTSFGPTLPIDMGIGRLGVPFFDFTGACSRLRVEGVSKAFLPTPYTCKDSQRAISVSTAGWESFTAYGFMVMEVPAGAATGALELHSGDSVPPFRLLAMGSITGQTPDSLVAMGEAPGWRWSPELRVTDFTMQQPLLDTLSFSTFRSAMVTSTPLYAQIARLAMEPPSRFRFPLAATVGTKPLLVVPGGGDGPACDSGVGRDSSADASVRCFAVKCRIGAYREDGRPIDLPQCAEHDLAIDRPGCCYGAGTPGAAVFVQLLPSPTSPPIPPGSRLEVTLFELQTSMSWVKPSVMSDAGLGEFWHVATESISSGANSTSTGGYTLLDDVMYPSPELFQGFLRAVVEPKFRFLSYDRAPVAIIFELPTSLPRSGASLRITAPPGFVFQSEPISLADSGIQDIASAAAARAGLSTGGSASSATTAVLALPAGTTAQLMGPRLQLFFPGSGYAALAAFVPYGFSVQVDYPDVRPESDNTYWYLQTLVEPARGGDPKPVHWARADGFVLGGGVPLLSLTPSIFLPLHPRNIIEFSFILSLPLPRAADPGPGVDWPARDRASMVVLTPPGGFVFPVHCRAPDPEVSASSEASSQFASSWASLPPPWDCEGVTSGAYSNATLLLIPAEGSARSGILVSDQRYKVWLVVQNPLYNLGSGDNIWGLRTRWAEKVRSFATLHEAQVQGFTLKGMQASVAPASNAPGAFHVANVSVTPRNDSLPVPGDSDPWRLSALLLVAPRGTELTCSGLLSGSLGGGSGPGGWQSSPERLACTTQDQLPSSGPCAQTGFDISPGIWTMCLSAPRRPIWASQPTGSSSCSMNIGLGSGMLMESEAQNGTCAAAGLPLWFGVPTLNPMYLPSDNMWLLAVLGDRGRPEEEEPTDGDRLVDVSGMAGYALVKQIGLR